MSKFEYAAIIQVKLWNKYYSATFWALYYGRIDPMRVYGENQAPLIVNIAIKTKLITEGTKELRSLQKEFNEATDPGLQERLTNKEVSDFRNRIQSKRKALEEETKRYIKQEFSNIINCHVLSGSALDLVNKAGKLGWETTGQVPGNPGPTGITMMRRRIE